MVTKEHLSGWRRAQYPKMSQRKAALEVFNVSIGVYRNWELGVTAIPESVDLAIREHKAKTDLTKASENLAEQLQPPVKFFIAMVTYRSPISNDWKRFFLILPVSEGEKIEKIAAITQANMRFNNFLANVITKDVSDMLYDSFHVAVQASFAKSELMREDEDRSCSRSFTAKDVWKFIREESSPSEESLQSVPKKRQEQPTIQADPKPRSISPAQKFADMPVQVPPNPNRPVSPRIDDELIDRIGYGTGLTTPTNALPINNSNGSGHPEKIDENYIAKHGISGLMPED